MGVGGFSSVAAGLGQAQIKNGSSLRLMNKSYDSMIAF
jgi:hypothetical protein